eukprot:COSAG06_NODE_4233_length_4446_cov_6.373821_6_plen_174_part_00
MNICDVAGRPGPVHRPSPPGTEAGGCCETSVATMLLPEAQFLGQTWVVCCQKRLRARTPFAGSGRLLSSHWDAYCAQIDGSRSREKHENSLHTAAWARGTAQPRTCHAASRSEPRARAVDSCKLGIHVADEGGGLVVVDGAKGVVQQLVISIGGEVPRVAGSQCMGTGLVHVD